MIPWNQGVIGVLLFKLDAWEVWSVNRWVLSGFLSGFNHGWVDG